MRALDKIKKINTKNKLLILGSLLVIVGILLSLPNAFASPTPVKSVTITSEKLDYTKKNPGSFNVEKSAEWIAMGKARITFDVDTIIKTENKYTDIIFVLDISGSMDGDKLTRVKQDSIDLINTLLSDSNNRGALITFETASQLVLGLTNNKDELTNAINSLTTTGCTNYYQALVNVDTILKNYKKEDNRECIVLFLTDGYPNEDTPNEEGQYSYLKKQYPYLTINGIQYEMGSDVLDPVKKVSDQQFIADMTNLNNILFEASVAPSTYNEFLITDYINNDYFEIDSVDNIVASVGTTNLEIDNNTPKVIWNIENLRSGANAKLTIDVKLKDEYLNKGGLYQTNKKEEVKSEIDGVREDITSQKTPILSSHYQVIYDGNQPDGCVAKNIPEPTTRSVFDTVEISNQGAVCDGYQFKGWTIATENIKKINDNYFEMPSSDVVIRANWGKMDIVKNMDGEIYVAQTLYKMIANQAFPDNEKSEFVTSSSGINFGRTPSDTNGKGVYTIANTKTLEYPVHYFRGTVDNNNVKFAGFCWKIVRTTETGGVKLIYNGVPDESGGCTTKTGTKTQIGTSAFNSSASSPADVGYMYGTRYIYNTKYTSNWYYYAGKTRLTKSDMTSTEYYYGNSVTYDDVTNTYTLNNPEKHLWSLDHWKLSGKYTCFKETNDGCEEVLYTTSPNQNFVHYISMTSGETYESLTEKANSYKWIYGNDVEYVDGKYILKDKEEYPPATFSRDSTSGFNAHRYTCFTTEDTCTNVNYFYYRNHYIILKDGKKIEDALSEMLTESSNENNSRIKTTIDTWYQNNMIDYTNMLEDTVWCNDRNIYQKNGWDKDSTSDKYLYFDGNGRNYSTVKPSISCNNDNDKFTVNSENGNGKLTYPIALLTADEATLAGHGKFGYSNASYLYTNQVWWVLSPSYFYSEVYSKIGEFIVDLNGGLEHRNIDVSIGVRPSVSLAPGVVVSDGNGTSSRPYEVTLDNR